MKHFQKLGIDYHAVKERIKDVIIKTLISVEPHIVNTMHRCTKHKNVCFEIYGFDILLDNKLKPWLLEVNISPSLSSSSPLDKKIKTALICDSLNLVGVQPYDRKHYERFAEHEVKNKLLGITKKSHDDAHLSKVIKMVNYNKQNMLQSINEDDANVIIDFEEEQIRTGNFDLIFPLANNIRYYS